MSEFDFGQFRKEKAPEVVQKPKPEKPKEDPKVMKRIIKQVKKTKMDFNAFMCKLEDSDSYASKHLKEKLNVRGKYRDINKERIIRVIRDVIDIINE